MTAEVSKSVVRDSLTPIEWSQIQNSKQEAMSRFLSNIENFRRIPSSRFNAPDASDPAQNPDAVKQRPTVAEVTLSYVLQRVNNGIFGIVEGRPLDMVQVAEDIGSLKAVLEHGSLDRRLQGRRLQAEILYNEAKAAVLLGEKVHGNPKDRIQDGLFLLSKASDVIHANFERVQKAPSVLLRYNHLASFAKKQADEHKVYHEVNSFEVPDSVQTDNKETEGFPVDEARWVW